MKKPPRPPPAALRDPTGAYVRIPLPAELVEAFGAWLERGRELAELAQRADGSVREFAERLREAGEAVERDVGRVRRARRARARRR